MSEHNHCFIDRSHASDKLYEATDSVLEYFGCKALRVYTKICHSCYMKWYNANHTV